MEVLSDAYNLVISKLNSMVIFTKGEKKQAIEGYLMSSDTANNRTLLLVKEGDKSWRTQWFNDKETMYISPSVPLSNIFTNKS
jgi:hypothetical protein